MVANWLDTEIGTGPTFLATHADFLHIRPGSSSSFANSHVIKVKDSPPSDPDPSPAQPGALGATEAALDLWAMKEQAEREGKTIGQLTMAQQAEGAQHLLTSRPEPALNESLHSSLRPLDRVAQ